MMTPTIAPAAARTAMSSPGRPARLPTASATTEIVRPNSSIARALAVRTGRCSDDLRVRVLAGAVVGVMMAVFLPDLVDELDGAGIPDLHAEDIGPESVERIDEALALLEDGFPL